MKHRAEQSKHNEAGEQKYDCQHERRAEGANEALDGRPRRHQAEDRPRERQHGAAHPERQDQRHPVQLALQILDHAAFDRF